MYHVRRDLLPARHTPQYAAQAEKYCLDSEAKMQGATTDDASAQKRGGSRCLIGSVAACVLLSVALSH